MVRRLEEKATLTTTVEKLRLLSTELAEALKEFPNDPSLLRLRLNLEPRIKQMEDELFVRDVSKSSAELPRKKLSGVFARPYFACPEMSNCMAWSLPSLSE